MALVLLMFVTLSYHQQWQVWEPCDYVPPRSDYATTGVAYNTPIENNSTFDKVITNSHTAISLVTNSISAGLSKNSSSVALTHTLNNYGMGLTSENLTNVSVTTTVTAAMTTTRRPKGYNANNLDIMYV